VKSSAAASRLNGVEDDHVHTHLGCEDNVPYYLSSIDTLRNYASQQESPSDIKFGPFTQLRMAHTASVGSPSGQYYQQRAIFILVADISRLRSKKWRQDVGSLVLRTKSAHCAGGLGKRINIDNK